MAKLILAAGVAALAISVPAVAQQGKADRGKGRSAQVQKERAGKVQKQHVQARKNVAQSSKAREKVRDRRANVAERVLDRRDRQLERRAIRRDALRVGDGVITARGVGWGAGGCPPGLAKKPVECLPPGQVPNLIGQRLNVLGDRVTLRELPNRLRVLYGDTPDYYYRYGNGFVYRVNRQNDVISSLLPLFGLGLAMGQPFPSAYSNYYLPTGLQPFYPNTSQDYYRYANGYVYEIDGRTGLIEDIDPLLGYGYGYGQMMPATYSAYNVPYQYRPLYYDTASSYYRYAPGAIYQVDPTTSLITAVAALLTGGMTVGQPLPMGYSAYNVPYGYRTTYYDTPNAWYRYSNGSIYRVDPTTQLVTALVASALT